MIRKIALLIYDSNSDSITMIWINLIWRNDHFPLVSLVEELFKNWLFRKIKLLLKCSVFKLCKHVIKLLPKCSVFFFFSQQKIMYIINKGLKCTTDNIGSENQCPNKKRVQCSTTDKICQTPLREFLPQIRWPVVKMSIKTLLHTP